MSTREEKCPTCSGPALDRNGFWETCWTPEPVSVDESRRAAHDRANRLQRQNNELRQLLREVRDWDIANYKLDIPQQLRQRIQGAIYAGQTIIALADGMAKSTCEELLDSFDEAQALRPHLLMEIGYTRPTGWMVHIWDASGVGISNAPKIICTQDESRDSACRIAAEQLRERVRDQEWRVQP